MSGSNLSNLLFIAMIVGVFYFLVIRPQQQRTKQQKAMIESLAVGDEIVSIGGMYGTIVEVGERIRVSVADGSELEFAPQAIARKVPAEPAEDEAADAGLVNEGAPADDMSGTTESNPE